MSNIDKRALRDLATALDGDDWHAEGNSVYGGAYDVGDSVCYDHIASCESVNGESPLADFIAAANPATVLALLDELEAAEKRIAELEFDLSRTQEKLKEMRDAEHEVSRRYVNLRRILGTDSLKHGENHFDATEAAAGRLKAGIDSRTLTVKLQGYAVREGHPINEGKRGVMFPKDGGPWFSRFEVEHALHVAGLQLKVEK